MKTSKKLEKASNQVGASLGILSVIFLFLLPFKNRTVVLIGLFGFAAILILCPLPEILYKASLRASEKESNNL